MNTDYSPYIGKWRCDKNHQDLNVISLADGALRVKQTFHNSGFFHWEPVFCTFEDGMLTIGINDDQNRAIYELRLTEGGTLAGTYTQYGETTALAYEKVSETPEDAEPYIKRDDKKVDDAGRSRGLLLREYAAYAADPGFGAVSYELETGKREQIAAIAEKYNLAAYTDGKTDLDLIFALLGFVCDTFRHNGSSGMPGDRTADGLIRYCEEHENSVNCRGLAMLLAQLLRAYGIPAYHVTCMPFEEPFDDCHVVTMCRSERLKKWFFIDPTMRVYLRNADGVLLNLRELRDVLISGGALTPNADANYNGGAFDLENYREYMTKNTLRFERGETLRYGYDDGWNHTRVLVLVPAAYREQYGDQFPKVALTTDPDLFWRDSADF